MQEYLDIIDFCNSFTEEMSVKIVGMAIIVKIVHIAILMNTLLYSIEYGVKPLESGSNTCFG